MSVGFGFSAGDFIAALKLVHTVVEALRETGSASIQCQSVIAQLLDLEAALLRVSQLNVANDHLDQYAAPRQAAAQCQQTIDLFWIKIRQYQPALDSSKASSRLKQSCMEVRWTLCQADDIANFQIAVTAHTQSINILLGTIQIELLNRKHESQIDRHRSLVQVLRDSFSTISAQIASVLITVSANTVSLTRLVDISNKVVESNCQISKTVSDIQHLLRNIPPQILKSQPIYFVDVYGKSAPFYLDFIQSKEAFLAVLQGNLKGDARAARRIQEGHFAITDTFTMRDVNMARAWDLCFRPGQDVEMSMISLDVILESFLCPSCKAEYNSEINQDTTCTKCSLIFRKLAGLTQRIKVFLFEPRHIIEQYRPKLKERRPVRVKKADYSQEIRLYRTVRLRTSGDSS